MTEHDGLIGKKLLRSWADQQDESMTSDELDYLESKERSVTEAAVSWGLLAGAAIIGYTWEQLGWWGIALLVVILIIIAAFGLLLQLMNAADNASFETDPRAY